MGTVAHLPDRTRLSAGMEAVRTRAEAVDASAAELRHAQAVLLRAMTEGRSTAAAIALAVSEFRGRT